MAIGNEALAELAMSQAATEASTKKAPPKRTVTALGDTRSEPEPR
jgi:hypothetical protein